MLSQLNNSSQSSTQTFLDHKVQSHPINIFKEAEFGLSTENPVFSEQGLIQISGLQWKYAGPSAFQGNTGILLMILIYHY